MNPLDNISIKKSDGETLFSEPRSPEHSNAFLSSFICSDEFLVNDNVSLSKSFSIGRLGPSKKIKKLKKMQTI